MHTHTYIYIHISWNYIYTLAVSCYETRTVLSLVGNESRLFLWSFCICCGPWVEELFDDRDLCDATSPFQNDGAYVNFLLGNPGILLERAKPEHLLFELGRVDSSGSVAVTTVESCPVLPKPTSTPGFTCLEPSASNFLAVPLCQDKGSLNWIDTQ